MKSTLIESPTLRYELSVMKRHRIFLLLYFVKTERDIWIRILDIRMTLFLFAITIWQNYYC